MYPCRIFWGQKNSRRSAPVEGNCRGATALKYMIIIARHDYTALRFCKMCLDFTGNHGVEIIDDNNVARLHGFVLLSYLSRFQESFPRRQPCCVHRTEAIYLLTNQHSMGDVVVIITKSPLFPIIFIFQVPIEVGSTWEPISVENPLPQLYTPCLFAGGDIVKLQKVNDT